MTYEPSKLDHTHLVLVCNQNLSVCLYVQNYRYLHVAGFMICAKQTTVILLAQPVDLIIEHVVIYFVVF